jgi:hypothetical protein
MKSKDVGALGELNPDGVVDGEVTVVILGELGAEASGLDADHGIDLGVEVVLAAEDFGGDLVFLKGGAGVIEGVFGNVAKKFTQGLRPVEDGAVSHFFDLSLDLRALYHVYPS